MSYRRLPDHPNESAVSFATLDVYHAMWNLWFANLTLMQAMFAPKPIHPSNRHMYSPRQEPVRDEAADPADFY